MRKREEILNDPKNWESLTLEVLLDIRELLIPKMGTIIPKIPLKKRGRPRKVK